MSTANAKGGPPVGPPPQPGPLESRLGFFLLRVLAPRLPRARPTPPPESFAPYERFAAPHALRPQPLAATWYPALGGGAPRGVVLLAHPWVPAGQAYFHRYRRIPALREAGLHALTLDLPGFGASGRMRGFWDRDLEQMLDVLARRAPGLPWHFWGVSSGGVWGHVLLGRRDAFTGAVFEDVSPHLLEWSWRTSPWGRPFYGFFRYALPRAYAFLDLRRHAPFLRVRASAYVAGGRDQGIPLADARGLAELARGSFLEVPAAAHLEAIRIGHDDILALALRTFASATAGP